MGSGLKNFDQLVENSDRFFGWQKKIKGDDYTVLFQPQHGTYLPVRSWHFSDLSSINLLILNNLNNNLHLGTSQHKTVSKMSLSLESLKSLLFWPAPRQRRRIRLLLPFSWSLCTEMFPTWGFPGTVHPNQYLVSSDPTNISKFQWKQSIIAIFFKLLNILLISATLLAPDFPAWFPVSLQASGQKRSILHQLICL